MNRSFGEWYRTANIEPSDEMLQKRWQGIEKYCADNVSTQQVLELIRLFVQGRTDHQVRDGFIGAFCEIDSAFPTNNDLELAVLAGATLVNIIEHFDKIDSLAVLALLAASFKKCNVAIPGVIVVAQEVLNSKSAGIRNGAGEKLILRALPAHKTLTDMLGAAKQTATLWTAAQVGEHLSAYIQDLDKCLATIRKFAKSSLAKEQMYREDSQILWWMTGEWSRDLQKPMSDYQASEICLVVGKELADLVEVLPGPYAAKAVLYKVLAGLGGVGDNVALSMAINRTGKEWRQRVVEVYPTTETREITPLLWAMSKSLEVENAEDWKPAYEKVMGRKAADAKMAPVKLAHQMYLECLVIKSLKENKD